MTSVEERIRESFAAQGMMSTLGIELVSVSPGEVILSAPVAPHTLQQHGTGHAALTFALGDVAAGCAALTLLPEGTDVMTAEIKINLMRPATGVLRAVGTVVKAGRRLSVVTAEVTDDAGKTVAILQGTMVPVPRD